MLRSNIYHAKYVNMIGALVQVYSNILELLANGRLFIEVDRKEIVLLLCF